MGNTGSWRRLPFLPPNPFQCSHSGLFSQADPETKQGCQSLVISELLTGHLSSRASHQPGQDFLRAALHLGCTAAHTIWGPHHLFIFPSLPYLPLSFHGCQTCNAIWRLCPPVPPPSSLYPSEEFPPINLLPIKVHLGICFLEEANSLSGLKKNEMRSRRENVAQKYWKYWVPV